MNCTVEKQKINLTGIRLQKVQLIKKALIDYNQSGKGDQYERDIMPLMIETLDEAIDQVMTNKYAAKVFGAHTQEVLEPIN